MASSPAKKKKYIKLSKIKSNPHADQATLVIGPMGQYRVCQMASPPVAKNKWTGSEHLQNGYFLKWHCNEVVPATRNLKQETGTGNLLQSQGEATCCLYILMPTHFADQRFCASNFFLNVWIMHLCEEKHIFCILLPVCPSHFLLSHS